MKYLFLIIITLGLSMGCFAKGYKIIGNVKDLNDNKIYLSLIGRTLKNIDSTKCKNGQFEFNGPEVSTPQQYSIRIENKFVPLAVIYLENGIITIEGTLYHTIVHGTPLNEALTEYNINIQSLRDQHVNLFYKDIMTKNQTAEQKRANRLQSDSLMNKIKSSEDAFIKKYNKTVLAVKLISDNSATQNSAELEARLKLLDPSLENNIDVVNLKTKALALKRSEIGQKAPDFSLATPEGKILSLSSYKGKYVLVDVWASWCAPCRASSPLLAEMYKKYKGHGLEIIGISCDTNKEKWIDAIKKDGLTWPQVIDSREKEKSVGYLYTITSIPYMALIDKDGVIIAKNLRGGALVEKLAEIIK